MADQAGCAGKASIRKPRGGSFAIGLLEEELRHGADSEDLEHRDPSDKSGGQTGTAQKRP